jgi:hypothetical protein
MAGLELFRGGQRARHAVHDHLKTYLNLRIGQLADAGLDVEPVQQFSPAWIPSSQVQHWPILMVTAHQGINLGRTDFVDGNPVHQWNWTIRSWVWARGNGYAVTADRAELAAAAIVDVFLGRPALGDPEDSMSVLPQPITVSLSDVEQDRRMKASIAGAFVEAVVTMAETATADAPLGTADVIDLAVEPKDPTA